MNTPIRDFVKKYAESDSVRLHMPGHKGKSFSGPESFDITEIDGADVLYNAKGIIKESEENAAQLFGSYRTYYSAEGSSLCIKAMLALAISQKKDKSEKPKVLAARNVHKAFIFACALLDIDVDWVISSDAHICACNISANDIDNRLKAYDTLPAAVYVTSPDYLGNMLDINSISKVCEKYNVPLLVDNAHGAYLHFLDRPAHPIDCGAFMCCDSAHKTLPVLTGGAYLHLSEKASFLSEITENMLSLFASTSPSYLILQSLDLCNAYLSDGYVEKLSLTVSRVDSLKTNLRNNNFVLPECEPLKIVINAAASGISTEELILVLRNHKIEVEFYDKDIIVMMFSCENSENDFKRVKEAFSHIKPNPIYSNTKEADSVKIGEIAMSIRNAIFSAKEIIPVEISAGRICACPTVSCPPAVPIVISGEIISQNAVDLMKKYNIDMVEVVK